MKAAFSGEIKASMDTNSSKAFENVIINALLTDYFELADQDKSIEKIREKSVFIAKNSITQYKMMSSVMDLISPEQFRDELGINIDKFNDVVLANRGYYQMLLDDYKNPEAVLRFNTSAFKNNYNFPDLLKMNLCYFCVKVGQCFKEDLDIKNEFEFSKKEVLASPEEILNEQSNDSNDGLLDVYDVVLAGIEHG